VDTAATTLQFNINIPENFSKAFKTQPEEAAGGLAAKSGTRFAITFNNAPSATKVYVKAHVTAATGTGAADVISSATATTDPSNTVAPLTGTLAGLTQVTIANGTGTVYYELTSSASVGALESLTVPVYFANSKGTLTAPTTAITATVSFAPVGSTNVPNFVSGSSTTTVNGSTFSACSTYLLFPYVTSATGFETGIAISNTSLDNFGAKGASSAATQTGTCALNFYGNSDATTNPPASTTAAIPGGTVNPFTLTSVAGSNFTGYMIANCNFQYAHGFAYIVYQFGTSNGAAMGYVASPFGLTGNAARGLGAGAAETLGN
jgi:hypothetical protein